MGSDADNVRARAAALYSLLGVESYEPLLAYVVLGDETQLAPAVVTKLRKAVAAITKHEARRVAKLAAAE